MSVTAIVPAAGSGTRFGANRNKILTPLLGQPILAWTLEALAASPLVDRTIIAVSPSDEAEIRVIAAKLSKPVTLVTGGPTRTESVRNALAHVETDVVAVHDAARPLVTPDIIARCIESAQTLGSGIAAIRVADTLKEAQPGNTILRTVDRTSLWATQTPQCCRTEDLRAAYLHNTDGATDEASLLQNAGFAVRLVEGSTLNLKVTTREDAALAEAILRSRGFGGESKLNMPRIGYGYDIHRFAAGRRMVLGGVDFGLEYGCDGHSDADAVLHAVMDALLGAAGLPDIGHLFPNTEEKWRGSSSLDLLAEVMRRINEAGYAVGNIDITIIAERPNIGPHASEMKAAIARSLGIPETNVGLKATTAEGLGDLGTGEGLAAHAVCMLFG